MTLSTAEAVEIRARGGNTMIVQIKGKKTSTSSFLTVFMSPVYWTETTETSTKRQQSKRKT